MVKSILVAIDGSAYTETVLRYAIYFGKKFNAHLRVLTVIDVRIFEWAVTVGVEGFAPIIPSSGYQEESQKLLEEKANQILQKTEDILKKEKLSFTLEKESGNPVDIICEKARLVDLVLMGARGEFARWSDKILGATLEAVSRLCIKPIFVSQKEYRPLKKLLASYDGSVNSNKALGWAAFFASTLKLPLQVVTVSSSPEEGEAILEEAREYLKAYEIPKLEFELETGDAAERIVAISQEKKLDLIILGAYGHSRIREAILGSTTIQVTRKANVPVLMVR